MLEFFRIYDESSKDPESSLQPLADITDGEARGLMTEIVDRFRQSGQYRVGDGTVIIERSEQTRGDDGEQQVSVWVCYDNSRGTTMDVATGKPVHPDPKMEYARWILIAANRGGWKIVNLGNEQVRSCA